MEIKNPFETAEAILSFIIPGLSSLNFFHAHDYDLIINDNTDNIYDSLLNEIGLKYQLNHTTVKVTFKTNEPEVSSNKTDSIYMPGNDTITETYLSQLFIILFQVNYLTSSRTIFYNL